MELADYEYTVVQKCEGKWRLFKWLMLFGYLVFSVIYFLIAYLTRFIPIVALLPLLLWILIYFTYKYVKPEYKYKITEAYIYFIRVVGKKEREILKIKICDADYILPLENAMTQIKMYEPKYTYSALPAVLTTDSYIILYKNEKDEPSAFMFKATSQALKCLYFYNKNTVLSDTEV